MHHKEKRTLVAQVKVDGEWYGLDKAIKKFSWKKVHHFIQNFIGINSFTPLFTLVQKTFVKRKFCGYVMAYDQGRTVSQKYLIVYSDGDKEDITLSQLEEFSANVETVCNAVTTGSEKEYDNSYWVFPRYLADVYAKVTRPYDLDAMEHSSGQTSMARRFYSKVDSVFQHDLTGLAVWANPDFDRMKDFLKHFLNCYDGNPEATSLVLVAPVWLNKSYWKLLHRFRLLDVLPKGMDLFVSPDRTSGELMSKGPTRWTTVVLYLGSRHQCQRLWHATRRVATKDANRLALVGKRAYCLAGDASIDGPVIEALVQEIGL